MLDPDTVNPRDGKKKKKKKNTSLGSRVMSGRRRLHIKVAPGLVTSSYTCLAARTRPGNVRIITPSRAVPGSICIAGNLKIAQVSLVSRCEATAECHHATVKVN